eukprot:1189113-Prorocentrum_minimum.AAC.2
MVVAAGNEHTCVILDTGMVKCWGRNIFGQLGIEDSSPKRPCPRPPRMCVGLLLEPTVSGRAYARRGSQSHRRGGHMPGGGANHIAGEGII